MDFYFPSGPVVGEGEEFLFPAEEGMNFMSDINTHSVITAIAK